MLTVRKAGNVYRADTWIDNNRVRLSLGTRNHDAAQRLASRIEKALSEGSRSELWAELKAVLPDLTFARLADSVGYVPPKIEAPKTWSDLRTRFEAHMQERIALRKFRDSTRDRYLMTLKHFETFLGLRGIVLLKDITNELVGEFKVWRLAQIQKRKESRGGTGLVLDVAILHKVFAVALKAKMIPENPVDFEGKPGADPTRGAQPFEAAQLERMRKHADQDLLTFLLLRWTGLRGSDAVTLRWSEVRLDTKEIERVTQKRTKKVILPIHSELLAVLKMERESRDPQPDDHVLLNPETGKPMNRPRLYHRMRALGKRAGVPNTHPHRFRDSFAVDMLARDGVSLYDVAKLLGDTVETVEKHYAEFVKGLRERVRRLMERTDMGLAAFEKALSETPEAPKKNRAKALTM